MSLLKVVHNWAMEYQKKAERPVSPYALCESCAKHGTVLCPNSSLCFALESKPYYQAKR
nr:MAG TPA: hypothetical protein [Siphoviridae sp. ctnpB30]